MHPGRERQRRDDLGLSRPELREAGGQRVRRHERRRQLDEDLGVALLGPGERNALRVHGDSMIEDGIRDGDLILVRRAPQAENGQTATTVMLS